MRLRYTASNYSGWCASISVGASIPVWGSSGVGKLGKPNEASTELLSVLDTCHLNLVQQVSGDFRGKGVIWFFMSAGIQMAGKPGGGVLHKGRVPINAGTLLTCGWSLKRETVREQRHIILNCLS